jgi:hypothetical protein
MKDKGWQGGEITIGWAQSFSFAWWKVVHIDGGDDSTAMLIKLISLNYTLESA